MWARWLHGSRPVWGAVSRSLCTDSRLGRLSTLTFIRLLITSEAVSARAKLARQLNLHRGFNGSSTEVAVGSAQPHVTHNTGTLSADIHAEDCPREKTLGNNTVQDHFSIDVLVNLLRQENAKDVCVIRIPPEVKYAEYFVVVSGTSTRHIQAMAQYTLKTYKSLKRVNESHVVIEGKDTDDWMCIDFGHIVVHFMLPELRELYELEKLWTLRSYDDQLSQILPDILPIDFTFGLQQLKE
ncbi:mitochondrial assembly of ribosomal large subunit protein 1 [Pelodytes ibericus]